MVLPSTSRNVSTWDYKLYAKLASKCLMHRSLRCKICKFYGLAYLGASTHLFMSRCVENISQTKVGAPTIMENFFAIPIFIACRCSLELLSNWPWLFVENQLFCAQRLSCSVRLWCMLGGSVEVWMEKNSILIHWASNFGMPRGAKRVWPSMDWNS